MPRIEKTVFISYRRTNAPWALAIYQDLNTHGFDVFFDYESIGSGSFEKIILENIKVRAHFLVILTPSALERCKDPNDWLRREIETAIQEKRNIVPLMLESFDFGSPLVIDALTGKLATLKSYNGLRVHSEYFFAAMEKLRERYLNVALEEIALPALNTQVAEITNTLKSVASEAPQVEKVELVAQEWSERSYVFKQNFDVVFPHNEYDWDIFISHASEDKETVVTPLVRELSKYPIKVWIDNQELKIGDSLIGKTAEGIAKSRYGIVILSPNFLAKKWTKRELEMLFMKSEEDDIVILPIWHGVTLEDVKSYNLYIASKLGIPTSKGLDYVAAEIVHRMWPSSDLRVSAKFVRELKYVDKTLDSLLRSSNISDIIALLFPDAPRNPVEYQMARSHVWRLIGECQPNYIKTDLPRNRAVGITNIENVDPFALLGHWVSIGVLSYALGEYEMLYDSIIAVQDVACQFQQEDIWVAGAKYSFGLSMFFLMRNAGVDKKTINQKLNEYCQKLIVNTDGGNMNERSHFLPTAFHEMAYRLWECKYDNNQERQTIPDDLLYSVKELALIIDSKTDHSINLSMWIETTFFDTFRTQGIFTKRPE